MIVRKLDEPEEEYSKRVAEDGGIFWKCIDCLKEGVIQSEHPLAIEKRNQFDRDYPHLVNISVPKVEIDKEDCPYCRSDN